MATVSLSIVRLTRPSNKTRQSTGKIFPTVDRPRCLNFDLFPFETVEIVYFSDRPLGSRGRDLETVWAHLLQADIQDIGELTADGSTVVQSDAAGFVDKESQNPAAGFRMKLNKDQFDTFRFTERLSDCENLPSDPLRAGLHGWSD